MSERTAPTEFPGGTAPPVRRPVFYGAAAGVLLVTLWAIAAPEGAAAASVEPALAASAERPRRYAASASALPARPRELRVRLAQTAAPAPVAQPLPAAPGPAPAGSTGSFDRSGWSSGDFDATRP